MTDTPRDTSQKSISSAAIEEIQKAIVLGGDPRNVIVDVALIADRAVNEVYGTAKTPIRGSWWQWLFSFRFWRFAWKNRAEIWRNA